MASNYFTRHWPGEHSLAVSYWVNGALLGNLFGTLIMGVAKVSDSGDFGTLRMSAGLSLAAIAVSMLAYAWAVVGIWRSARWARRW